MRSVESYIIVHEQSLMRRTACLMANQIRINNLREATPLTSEKFGK